MMISFVVFGLAVFVAVQINSGDARATASREELLDELTKELLVRYVERRKPDASADRIESKGIYDSGLVRRWWGNNPSFSTGSSQTASNSGDINNNYINGGLTAGAYGNQGRK